MRALAVLVALAAPAQAGEVDLAGLLARLGAEPPQVAVLGEVHDNPDHHAVQAAAVAVLKPAAIVLEMATMDEAAAAAGVDRTDAAALAAALGWPGSGWPDFALYHPVLAAAPGARLYGAEVPGDEVRRAVTEGAAAVFGPDAAAFGLDRALPAAEQAAREEEQFTAHCAAMPRGMMGGMVEAQRLRDAHLAQAALQALRETGGPVAVITGWGHARKDWGVPALIGLADPGVRVLSLGQLEADPGPDAPFDLWIVADPVPRGDPCAVFRDG